MKKVSVIIPAYRCSSTLRQAIDSALIQEVPLEILVLDDCSGEDIEGIVKEYGEEPRLRYLKNEKNLGAAASRNRGVQLASGDYVAFLDADDWWEPKKLEKQLKLLEETKDVLACTGRRLCSPEGEELGKYIPVKKRITYQDLLRHNSINCSSVLLRREDALAFPMEHDDSHEDYITWLRILRKGGFAAGINRPYLKYRLSEGGKSRNKLKSAAMTYQVYRYVGYGPLKSLFFFVSYAFHGIWKYR